MTDLQRHVDVLVTMTGGALVDLLAMLVVVRCRGWIREVLVKNDLTGSSRRVLCFWTFNKARGIERDGLLLKVLAMLLEWSRPPAITDDEVR